MPVCDIVCFGYGHDLIKAIDYSTPVLLQQILRTMEDANAPRSAVLVYTTLSLILRLIAAQSSVFGTWYSRRAYERCRGELITMIYEKTLSRKIVGTANKPGAEQNGDILANGNGLIKEPEKSRWRKAWTYAIKLFRFSKTTATVTSVKAEKPKEPASMGKIINLMR